MSEPLSFDRREPGAGWGPPRTIRFCVQTEDPGNTEFCVLVLSGARKLNATRERTTAVLTGWKYPPHPNDYSGTEMGTCQNGFGSQASALVFLVVSKHGKGCRPSNSTRPHSKKHRCFLFGFLCLKSEPSLKQTPKCFVFCGLPSSEAFINALCTTSREQAVSAWGRDMGRGRAICPMMRVLYRVPMSGLRLKIMRVTSPDVDLGVMTGESHGRSAPSKSARFLTSPVERGRESEGGVSTRWVHFRRPQTQWKAGVKNPGGGGVRQKTCFLFPPAESYGVLEKLASPEWLGAAGWGFCEGFQELAVGDTP